MKAFIIFLLLHCSFYSFAQKAATIKDTLILTDGTVYAGTVIMQDKHSRGVQFMTEDGQIHDVSSSTIAQIRWANPQGDNKLPYTEKKPSSQSSANETQDDQGINWSDPGIPHSIVEKHNKGIGLTIAGTVLTVVGIGMIAGGAASNGQVTTVNNGYTTQTNVNVGAVGGVGIVFTLAGLPTMIVGAVKTARSKKLARASLIHLY